MKKIAILIAVAVLFTGANSFADTIVLKSGEQIEAQLLGRSSDSIEIDSNGTRLSYPAEEVDTINGEQVFVVIPPVNPVIEETAPAQAPQAEVKPVEPEPPLPEEVSVTAEKQPDALSLKVDVKEPSSSLVKSSGAKVDPAKLKADKEVALVALFAVIFILLLVYSYSAVCLQFIAKKTNTSPVWLAWVPAGNIFLMCKIGGVNYWWMLVLLLILVPWYIISMPVSLGFFGFVWYKISLARNKPGWVGILTVIPIAQFFIYGYLAFSNHKAAPAPQPVSPPAPPAEDSSSPKQ